MKTGEIEREAKFIRSKIGRGIPVNVERVASVLGFKLAYSTFDDQSISAVLDYGKKVCTVRNDPREDFKRLFVAHAMAYFMIYQHHDQKKKQNTRTLNAWVVGDKEDVQRLAVAIMVPGENILEVSNTFDRRGCVHTKELMECESKTACLAKTFGIPAVAMAKRLRVWSSGELG